MSFLRSSLFLTVFVFMAVAPAKAQAKWKTKKAKAIKKAPARAVKLRDSTTKLQIQSQQQTQDFARKLEELKKRKHLLKELRRRYRTVQKRKSACSRRRRSHINNKIKRMAVKQKLEQRRIKRLKQKYNKSSKRPLGVYKNSDDHKPNIDVCLMRHELFVDIILSNNRNIIRASIVTRAIQKP